ncbi:MAG: tricarballylate utilization 4Fe-4S protein TcuB [Gammaproteobacteria bacterium]|nr:tricarballylate utilization 4Fe-4S protein TcuB [Gammaproteobacteria bacterium]MYL01753.1 tricarballylate utilization 4Fe-4S protein TcuB [Gammaproteobacteria bacterium]
MNICNACRYCEGVCAVFPAMSLQRAFSDHQMHYLANLCHNCTACYHNCQYAPPHPFAVNVPGALTELRAETYELYAWPGFLGRLFRRNGLFVSLATALALSIVLALASTLVDPDVMFAEHSGPGSFYAVISHGVMVAVAGSTFCFSLLALSMGVRRFWRETGSFARARPMFSAFCGALTDMATLQYLGGGHKEGCSPRDEGRSNQRRYFHQAAMWGFVLCFASTCVAAFYDYALGRVAPYPFLSLPVMLGTIGGIGLLVGPAGLFWLKLRSDKTAMPIRHYGMDYAFLALLFVISLTGFMLLALRETAAMGLTLAIHLGFVLALFLTLPYSKFVHAFYRFAALLRFNAEKPEQSRPATVA